MAYEIGVAVLSIGSLLFAMWCAIAVEKHFNPPRFAIWATFFAVLALSLCLAAYFAQ